jgi:hypothetical protein
MQGRHRAPGTTNQVEVSDPLRRVAALAWVGPDVTIVARRTASGWVDVVRVARDEDAPTYLGRVAHQVGDAARVLIMGPDGLRTQLEREYVAIFHHPDRLVDVEPAGDVTEAALVERLRALDA